MHRVLALLLFVSLAAVQNPPAPTASSPIPGQIDPHRICAAKPDQSYALYLPSTYTPTKRWPIVYAFDPAARGDRPIDILKAGAEEYGYIVAASNNSRNGPWSPEIEAAQAVSDDTHTILSIDDRRVYFTGFSGGARVASQIALDCKCAAGVYLNGAGFPIGKMPSPKDSVFPVFATVGNVDFNFPEVTHLDEALATDGYPHFLRYFEGPHQWAPSEVAEEALVWFRLVAMKKDVAPRDPDFIAQQREAALARGKAIEQSGDLYVAWRDYNESAATFEQLTDTATFRQAASTLASQKAVRDGAKRQRQEFEEQADLTADISAQLNAFNQLSPNLTASVNAAKQQISNLRETAAHQKRPEKALVYRRAVAQIFVHAMETGIERLEAKDITLARDYFLLAAEANPDSPAPLRNLAIAQAMDNNRKAAIETLCQAKLKVKDMPPFLNWLQSEPTFAPFRDDPAFKALLTTSFR